MVELEAEPQINQEEQEIHLLLALLKVQTVEHHLQQTLTGVVEVEVELLLQEVLVYTVSLEEGMVELVQVYQLLLVLMVNLVVHLDITLVVAVEVLGVVHQQHALE